MKVGLLNWFRKDKAKHPLSHCSCFYFLENRKTNERINLGVQPNATPEIAKLYLTDANWTFKGILI